MTAYRGQLPHGLRKMMCQKAEALPKIPCLILTNALASRPDTWVVWQRLGGPAFYMLVSALHRAFLNLIKITFKTVCYGL
ncbi:MAG: hypothetical protein CTY16_11225 [Methylobacter sp.]|nr:MAG: hypothetical protein CTY16_11225 [Methylobacter sp.]